MVAINTVATRVSASLDTHPKDDATRARARQRAAEDLAIRDAICTILDGIVRDLELANALKDSRFCRNPGTRALALACFNSRKRRSFGGRA